MVKMHLKYLGQLKAAVTHEPSGTELITVAPKDNLGDGSSFSPTDLTATSLLSCMTITMGIVAQRHDTDLTPLQASVEKEMVATPHRRIGRLIVNFEYRNELTDDIKNRLERAALGCPVAKSLSPETIIETTFNWNGSVKKYVGHEKK